MTGFTNRSDLLIIAAVVGVVLIAPKILPKIGSGIGQSVANIPISFYDTEYNWIKSWGDPDKFWS